MATYVHKNSIILIVVLTFSIVISTPTVAATYGPKSPKALCRIEIGKVHLSTYLSEVRKLRAIKVNAISICNVTQRNVKLTVRLYKVGFFHDYLVAHGSTDPSLPSSSGFRVRNQDVYMKCKSDTKSRYYGVAFAEAIIGGQRFVAPPARSVEIPSIKCGS